MQKIIDFLALAVRSRTMWGGVLLSVANILTLFHVVDISALDVQHFGDQVVGTLQALAAFFTWIMNLVGTIMVFWGRITAKGPLIPNQQ